MYSRFPLQALLAFEKTRALNCLAISGLVKYFSEKDRQRKRKEIWLYFN